MGRTAATSGPTPKPKPKAVDDITARYGGVGDAPALVSGDNDVLPPDLIFSGTVVRPAATQGSGIRRLDNYDPGYGTTELRLTNSVGVASLAPEQLAELQLRLANVGFMGESPHYVPGFMDDLTIKAILTLQRHADVTYAAPALDVLAGMEAAGGMFDPFAEAKAKAALQPSTRTVVNLTDPTTAKVILRRTLEAELGRAPTAAETAQFRTALNDKEELFPQVATTDYDDEGNEIVTTSGDQAPSPEVFADEFARSGRLGGERNVKRSGVNFYRAALGALGPGGGMLSG